MLTGEQGGHLGVQLVGAGRDGCVGRRHRTVTVTSRDRRRLVVDGLGVQALLVYGLGSPTLLVVTLPVGAGVRVLLLPGCGAFGLSCARLSA